MSKIEINEILPFINWIDKQIHDDKINICDDLIKLGMDDLVISMSSKLWNSGQLTISNLYNEYQGFGFWNEIDDKSLTIIRKYTEILYERYREK